MFRRFLWEEETLNFLPTFIESFDRMNFAPTFEIFIDLFEWFIETMHLFESLTCDETGFVRTFVTWMNQLSKNYSWWRIFKRWYQMIDCFCSCICLGNEWNQRSFLSISNQYWLVVVQVQWDQCLFHSLTSKFHVEQEKNIAFPHLSTVRHEDSIFCLTVFLD